MRAMPHVRALVSTLCLIVIYGLCGSSFFRAEETFVRGDINSDGQTDLTDAVYLLQHLFENPRFPPYLSCLDAADCNDDGRLNITDSVFLLSALFRGGPEAPAPYPDCGVDPTPDGVGCEEYYPCTPTVYGQPIEADLVVFCVDNSSWMAGYGELTITKHEIAHYVSVIPPDKQFGIVVVHDQSVEQFPADGIPAWGEAGVKEAAHDFIFGIRSEGGSCPREGLLAAVAMANASHVERREILHFGGGGGASTCAGEDPQPYLIETLSAVGTANTAGIPINVVGLLVEPGIHEEFLKSLASESGGWYHHQVWSLPDHEADG